MSKLCEDTDDNEGEADAGEEGIEEEDDDDDDDDDETEAEDDSLLDDEEDEECVAEGSPRPAAFLEEDGLPTLATPLVEEAESVIADEAGVEDTEEPAVDEEAEVAKEEEAAEGSSGLARAMRILSHAHMV